LIKIAKVNGKASSLGGDFDFAAEIEETDRNDSQSSRQDSVEAAHNVNKSELDATSATDYNNNQDDDDNLSFS